MKNQILNLKSLMFLFAIALLTYGTQGISYGQVCNVGDILSPGESCTYPGTNAVFSVDAEGNALFQVGFVFFRVGGNLNIRNSNINGTRYTLVTEHSEGGGRRITELGGTIAPPPEDESETPVVDIPDPNLRTAIESALGMAPDALITGEDMARLTRLEAPNANISDLTGLEHAINLEWLNLDAELVEGEGWINSNTISDLSPLAGLTNLRGLSLGINNITDISAVSGLTNLTELSLGVNSIADISAVSGLTNLTELWLWGTSVTDISAVSGLTNLTVLSLGSNSITDISAVSGLTNLTTLWLTYNNITDISAVSGLTNLTFLSLGSNTISNISSLVENTGLGDGDTVDVSRNPLNSTSINTHIPTLQRRGVDVQFDEPASVNTTVSVSPASVQSPAIGEQLTLSLNIENGQNIASYELTVTFDSTALSYVSIENGGYLSPGALVLPSVVTDTSAKLAAIALSGTADGDGTLATITFTVVEAKSSRIGLAAIVSDPTANPIDLTVRGGMVTGPASIAQPVNIPDSNLRAAVEGALGKGSGDVISADDMAGLTEFSVNDAGISDLTGLEYATNLRNLRLGADQDSGLNSNSISDISPLSGLTNLRSLALEGNSISNISPLSGLTNLRSLVIWGNSISDISPLSGLTNLSTLFISNNSILDISPLSGLTNLRSLAFGGNSISDISALAGLSNLEMLWIYNNGITDISVLAGLLNLENLNLGNNSIMDISALSGLTNLTNLHLWNNSITDLSPLVANTGLGNGDRVHVGHNPLNYASINTHIPALQRRGVTVEFDNVVTEPELVNIPDPNLRAAIEKALGKASGATITTADMARLTRLKARNAGISDLTGLEVTTNLTRLDLYGGWIDGHFVNSNSVSDLSPLRSLTNLTSLNLGLNGITDISAVSGLTNLTDLSLRNNSITDISAVSTLTNLTSLSLGLNGITDISAVSGLTNLTYLGLGYNTISDISALAGLTNLTDLTLWYNTISDISSVAGLTNLTRLYLNDNAISDLSPLVANTGLGNGDKVDVSQNPLNYASINTHIPALQSRGVDVSFYNLKPPVDSGDVDIPDPNLRAAIEKALGKASGATITTADMARLTRLEARNAGISDLTGLEVATNLTTLLLGGNNITDISVVSTLTNLIWLHLGGNSITDISAVSTLTNLTGLVLGGNSITDISAVSGLTNLTWLHLDRNSITDISAVSGLTNLTELVLYNNSITDISAVSTLTNLTRLRLGDNSIMDISAVSTLINLTKLILDSNSITDVSAVSGLANLTQLWLQSNPISDISAVSTLTNLTSLALTNNNISDISALVSNTGLGNGDRVNVGYNPLNYASIHTHIPVLQRRGVEVNFANLKPTTLDFHLSVPAGISLIHVLLKVRAVDGVAKTIESIADLYDALGGAGVVTFLITYDPATGDWLSYFGASDRGTAPDRTLTDEMGIIANLVAPTTVLLTGNALGTEGSSTITLTPGLNLVGLPLNDSTITRVSDLFALEGIRGNVPVVILAEGGDFKSVGRAGDPGDIPITGGQGFILTAQRAATVAISGEGWTNTSAAAAAAPMVFRGMDTTPVLSLRGAIIDQHAALNFRVTVKNLSTGRSITGMTKVEAGGYQLTYVDVEMGQAAAIGDTLEISAQSANPFIGVEPVRYTITAEDVRRSLIQLPELVAYEIPAETQLLSNYPNPFNPETWIPYRLAEDAFVTLTIYDQTGQVVRTIDVGHRIAAVYESRSKAIYWDGRNNVGEQVASGVFFYHLSAGDYSATRKMVILK